MFLQWYMSIDTIKARFNYWSKSFCFLQLTEKRLTDLLIHQNYAGVNKLSVQMVTTHRGRMKWYIKEHLNITPRKSCLNTKMVGISSQVNQKKQTQLDLCDMNNNPYCPALEHTCSVHVAPSPMKVIWCKLWM